MAQARQRQRSPKRTLSTARVSRRTTRRPVAFARSAPTSPAMPDEVLADQLARIAPDRDVLIVTDALRARVFSRRPGADWAEAGHGEFGSACLAGIKALIVAKRVNWISVANAFAEVHGGDEQPATVVQLRSWVKKSEALCKPRRGRAGDITNKTEQEIILRAGGRCQFPGCGEDLRAHLATGHRGNFGYLAHIVAASPEGPRGHKVRSALLVDDPDNFLLLCDKCHRMIDRVAPDDFDEGRLQEIRRASIHEVQRLLDTLRYDEATPLAVIGNITGQPAHLEPREVDEALWSSKLRARKGEPERLGHVTGSYLDPHKPLWGLTFGQLRQDFSRLHALLTGSASASHRPTLAVFGLHSTSMLLLLGRVLGDHGNTHLFQPHRNQRETHGRSRWTWPKAAALPNEAKFTLDVLREPKQPMTAACLLVSLTYRVTDDRLPMPCAQAGAFLLPTVEIRTREPGQDCISHPQDLVNLGCVVDRALQMIQDKWKATHVHLFVGAPASAVVRVGQKLQARHHATVTCYETPPGPGAQFAPTIEISSTQVRDLSSGEVLPLVT
jgi:hypothetical protein